MHSKSVFQKFSNIVDVSHSVSDYNGNLAISHNKQLHLPNGLDVQFGINYNANVGHHTYRGISTLPSGGVCNAPEWIMSVGEFAVQTLNFEKNWNVGTYNNFQWDGYPFMYQETYTQISFAFDHMGAEIPFLLEGYHYTNSICISEANDIINHDMIKLLKADGSCVELINPKYGNYDNTSGLLWTTSDYPDSKSGVYVEVGHENRGYAVVEWQDQDFGLRNIYYKPGNGLTYYFEEEYAVYQGLETEAEWQQVVEKQPRIAYLKKVISAMGDFIEVDYTANAFGHTNTDGRKFLSSVKYYDSQSVLRKDIFSFEYWPKGTKLPHDQIDINDLASDQTFTMNIWKPGDLPFYGINTNRRDGEYGYGYLFMLKNIFEVNNEINKTEYEYANERNRNFIWAVPVLTPDGWRYNVRYKMHYPDCVLKQYVHKNYKAYFDYKNDTQLDGSPWDPNYIMNFAATNSYFYSYLFPAYHVGNMCATARDNYTNSMISFWKPMVIDENAVFPEKTLKSVSYDYSWDGYYKEHPDDTPIQRAGAYLYLPWNPILVDVKTTITEYNYLQTGQTVPGSKTVEKDFMTYKRTPFYIMRDFTYHTGIVTSGVKLTREKTWIDEPNDIYDINEYKYDLGEYDFKSFTEGRDLLIEQTSNINYDENDQTGAPTRTTYLYSNDYPVIFGPGSAEQFVERFYYQNTEVIKEGQIISDSPVDGPLFAKSSFTQTEKLHLLPNSLSDADGVYYTALPEKIEEGFRVYNSVSEDYDYFTLKTTEKEYYSLNDPEKGSLLKTTVYGEDIQKKTEEEYEYYTSAGINKGFLKKIIDDRGYKEFFYNNQVNYIAYGTASFENSTVTNNYQITHNIYQVEPFKTVESYGSYNSTKYSGFDIEGNMIFITDDNGYYYFNDYDKNNRLICAYIPGTLKSSPENSSENINQVYYSSRNLSIDVIDESSTRDLIKAQVSNVYRESGGKDSGDILVDTTNIVAYSFLQSPLTFDNLVDINEATLTLNCLSENVSAGEDHIVYIRGIIEEYNERQYEYDLSTFETSFQFISDTTLEFNISSLIWELEATGNSLYGVCIYTSPLNGSNNSKEFNFSVSSQPSATLNYEILNSSDGFVNYDYDDIFKLPNTIKTVNRIANPSTDQQLITKYSFDRDDLYSSVENYSPSESHILKTYPNYFGQDFFKIDPENRGIKFYYDIRGELTKQASLDEYLSTEIASKFLAYNYNVFDPTDPSYDPGWFRMVTATDEESHNITRTYFDMFGKIVKNDEIHSNNPTIYSYNNKEQLDTVTSPEGFITTYEYNQAGLLKKKKNNDVGRNDFIYDKFGNLRFSFHEDEYSDYLVKVQYFNYDNSGRLKFKGIVEIGHFITYNSFIAEFDGDESYTREIFRPAIELTIPSLEIWSADYNKFLTANMYDSYNKTGVFSQMSDPESPAVINGRNLNGKLVATAFRDFTTDSWNYKIFGYDELGNISHYWIKMGSQDWVKVETEYDLAGNITYQNIPDHHFWYKYDDFGRLEQVLSNQTNNKITAVLEGDYTYNNTDQLTSFSNAALTNPTTYSYSSTRGWLLSISGHNQIFQETLLYQDNGLIEQMTIDYTGAPVNSPVETWGNHYFNYTYNHTNQLIQSKYNNNLYNDNSEEWNYDKDGNVIEYEKPLGGIISYFTYIAGSNKLTCVNDIDGPDGYRYSYDTWGNVKQKKDDLSLPLYSFNNYNTLNLNTELVDHQLNATYHYKYDENGQRIYKEKVGDASSGEFYLVDQFGKTLAVYNTEIFKPKMINIHGNDLIGRIDLTWVLEQPGVYIRDVDERLYYIKDHLGNIRLTLSENNSEIISAQDYKPFGEIYRDYNNADYNGKYKFSSKEKDTESELDYFGARYYDSKIFRWLTVDPLADKYSGWSSYNYCINNPMRYIDPDGKDVYLLTWAPNGEQVGHSALAIQQRDAEGNLTGNLVVRHLWPESPVGKSGESPADYKTEVVPLSDLKSIQGGEGRVADGIIKLGGDATFDNKVMDALNKAETNKTYNAETNSCAGYTKKGLNAVGQSGGNGANVKVNQFGVTIYDKNNVTTPVSVHNAVANSKQKNVTVIKKLKKEQQNANMVIE